jgi:hypothetical protein
VTDNVYSPCESCRFAKWQRTANGRRHPSGDGRCTWAPPDAPLPLCVVGSWQTRGALTVAAHVNLSLGNRYISRHAKWMRDEPCRCHEPLSGTKRADV